MDQETDHRSLLLFGGDRLWSSLDALARWGDHLERVALVVTIGDDEDGGPVDRLSEFVRSRLPDVELVVRGPVSPQAPQEIFGAVTDLADLGGRWLVDVSGTSGLVTVGACMADSHPQVTLVHREVDGRWFAVEGRSARLLPNRSPAPLDRFDAAGLIEVTWSDSERTARVTPARVEPEIEQAALRATRRHDTRWEQGFVQAARAVRKRLNGRPGEGMLFEQYVVATLRALGVDADDLVLGVTLVDGDIAVQEVDVVAQFGGRLHVVDCKLTSQRAVQRRQGAPIGMQIREAYTTKQHLGDGADQLILLRPRMTVREELVDLGEEYGLVVVDRTVLAREPLSVALDRLVMGGTWRSAG